jgi:hypothetical protein
MNKTSSTYHNDPAFKERFLAEITWHEQQDMLIQGDYGNGLDGDEFQGCAVGCSVDSLNRINGTNMATNDHVTLATTLGIPVWLAHLEDTLFEGLPDDDARTWPSRLAEAIPVGVDLEPVRHLFEVWLMDRNIARVEALDIPADLKTRVVAAIRLVRECHAVPTKADWDGARSAAYSAYSALAAAYSAAYSAYSALSAAYSARSAAYSALSAAYSADSAAYSAYSALATAYSAAYSAYSADMDEYQAMSEHVLDLITQQGVSA